MPRKEKIVVELSPEVVALLRRIADVIAPEHHAPPIGETKRLVESDQRDHQTPLRWTVKGDAEIASMQLTPAEVEQVEELLDASGVEPTAEAVEAVKKFATGDYVSTGHYLHLPESPDAVPDFPAPRWWNSAVRGVD